MKNEFYIVNTKEKVSEIFFANKTWEGCQNHKGQPLDGSTNEGVFFPIDVTGVSRLKFIFEDYIQRCTLTFLDKNYEVISSVAVAYNISNPGTGKEYIIEILNGALYVSITLQFDSSISASDYNYKRYEFVPYYKIVPHYKSLKISSEKENDQVFFRDKLDGKMVLCGPDCDKILYADIESLFYFYYYQDSKLQIEAKFSKSDCKFDTKKHTVELSLNILDRYTTLLEKFENTYDLLKLGVAKTKATLAKRAVIQVYIAGSDVVTSYINGTVYEHEVKEVISDVALLKSKYYFSETDVFRELALSGFNYNINASIVLTGGKEKIEATTGNQQFSIVFEKVASKNELADYEAVCLSDEVTKAYKTENYKIIYLYDIYRIGIYTKINGSDYKIYSSKKLYGNDNNLTLVFGENKYPMKCNNDLPGALEIPTPETFNLSSMVITYNICMRILCDVKTSADGQTVLYDLPSDDFVTHRANYRYCIGLTNKDSQGKKRIHIVQSDRTQKDPTPFGLTEQGTYFVQPERIVGDVIYEMYPFPLAKSTWGNASLWIGFEEGYDFGIQVGLEVEMRKFRKSVEHKDAMEIGAVVKALLSEIDSNIKFECTSDYSNFLYSAVNIGTASHKQKILISQKSNVLKGEYDQPAQKAEVTFKSIMELLRDCFRCYWYIDDDGRFRIEHIKYFMNGLSYDSNQQDVVDFRDKYDKFNSKLSTYAQGKCSYSKSELSSRYEFSWGDSAISEAMGSGFSVEIISNITEPDKKESINLQSFSPDIDMMFYVPENFSQDGFAIFSTDEEGAVPIDYIQYTRTGRDTKIVTCIQNPYLSFLHLFDNYKYDLPARQFKTSTSNSEATAISIKKSMEHEVKVYTGSHISPLKLIYTDFGRGSIKSIKTNIDTGFAEMTLNYIPS